MHYLSLSLREPNSKKETSIFLYITYKGQRLKVSTGERIHPSLWMSSSKSITKSKAKLDRYEKHSPAIKTQLISLQIRIDKLIKEVDNYFIRMQMNSMEPNLSDLRSHLKRFLSPNKSTVIFNDVIIDFLDVFIEECSQGYRKKSNGKPYRKASIVCYENLKQALTRFERSQNKAKLRWSSINKDFYYSFIKWHEDHKYAVNYTGRHLKDLKSLMRVAYEEKLHTNDAFRMKYFSVPKEVNKKIPLSLDEIQRLIDLDLSHNRFMDLSRNIFVLGTCVGLRVSDLKQISPKTIIDDSQGKYIRLKTIKTGAVVNIPINSIAMDILTNYNYQLPDFREQVVNRHLKELAGMIGLPKERAVKLSLHYSRATFAKLAYKQGVPSLYIMRVTGHTSEQNFLRYINIAPEEAVSEFRKHEFFR